MDKISVFEKEISYIKDDRLKENIKIMINLLPDYFFKVPASSTGKYHPDFAQGTSGLVRHTKAAVRFAYEIINNNSIGYIFNDLEKDLIIMALIMHDGCKHGIVQSKYTIVEHPLVVSKLIKDNKDKLTLTNDELELLCSMIESHMGEFNKDFQGNEVLPRPLDKYSKFVHMCDFLASKKFININFESDNIVD